MMKNSFLVFLILLFGAFPGSSNSQFLGQLNTAKTFEPGEFNLGAYLGVYEEAISTFGQFRLGISECFDMGVKVGVLDFQSTDVRDEVGIIIGGDLKYNLLNTEINNPFDLSLGLSWEHADVKNPSIFAGGVNMIISKGFVMESGNLLSPYGRLNLRAERKIYKLSGKERTDTARVGATVGAVLQAREGWHFVGEFQMDEHYGFLLGLSYHIY
jgi:hypothetical protein